MRPPKLPLHTRHLQGAAAKAASFPLLGFQRAATKAASTPRHLQGAAAKVEQFVAWVSAISSHTSSPLPPYSPQVQEGHVNSYFGKCRRRRSYGSSNGPKRRHGDRRVRSYGDRIVHNNGGGRVYSYGTRRGHRKENRNVRSYGDRRVYSYGERQGFSYGDRYRRWCLYDRKRQPVVQSGHSESESGKWFRTRLTASDIKLTASRVGAFWVAGHFLTTFTHNLNFNNLPAILIEKYQLAGNEVKSLSQAQAVWESIPVQVRAGGPRSAVEVAPRQAVVPHHSQIFGRTFHRGQRDLVGLREKPRPGGQADESGRHSRRQSCPSL